METERSKSKTIYIRWFFIRFALVVFDILAVNFSYFMALVVRFYVNFEFNEWAVKYVPAFLRFAPYYTVCCLVIFYCFKLYNSMWKYAGLNDMNRILAACLVTCAVQVVGSVCFVMRMPITYYCIGAVIQFVLIAASRFSYRIFLMERERIRNRRSDASINVMIVGVGDTGRIVLKHFEQDTESAAHTVCMVDYRGEAFGNRMEGVPVISGIDKIASSIKKYAVECVILADTIMPQNTRKEIKDICAENHVEVQDFSGYFQDMYGAFSLRMLLEHSNGPVELMINGKRQSFANGEQALMSVTGKYVVKTVSARDNKLVIELQKDILVPNDVKEEWVRSYEKETGEDISFF